MLKDTGRLISVRPRVSIMETSRVASITDEVVEGAMEPASVPVILEPSSKAPTSSPVTVVKMAPANDSEPEPLRLPMRKELLFHPKMKLRRAARPMSRLSIAFRDEDQDYVAGVLCVVGDVVRDEHEVAKLDDCHRVHRLFG